MTAHGRLLAALPVVIVLGLCGAAAARADGVLPPMPYRYLHPPPALKGDNKPPAAGVRVLPSDYLRAVIRWTFFTPDGQAGISGAQGTVRVSGSATAVILRLVPVETPPGLPKDVAADGNAYRVTATEKPSGSPVTFAHPISVILSWPHIPVALYTFRAGRWSQLCYSAHAVLTSRTISCSASRLGIFLAVTLPSNSASPVPTTPISDSQFAWVARYIPLLAVLAVVLGAAAAGYAVTRPDKPSGRTK
jgi:hypothetical protein